MQPVIQLGDCILEVIPAMTLQMRHMDLDIQQYLSYI